MTIMTSPQRRVEKSLEQERRVEELRCEKS
jgi:hypothetical protein